MKSVQLRTGPARWLGYLLLACCPCAFAGIVNVDIVNFAFSPVDVTIHANDQVKWTWLTSFHSSTSGSPPPGSANGIWDSGVHNSGNLFTNTFPNAGYFPYFCTVHDFTGTVTVVASNAATNVDIVNFAFSPANVTINAGQTVQWTWVSDDHSSTSDAGDTTMWDSGIQNTGYVFTNTFPSGGTFPYFCVVHGFTGSVTVLSSSPSLLTAAQFILPSTFQFAYSAGVGQSYVVERSSDLALWTPLVTNMASSNPVMFRDTNAPAGSSFYRIVQLSAP
jgi:plastocyanin